MANQGIAMAVSSLGVHGKWNQALRHRARSLCGLLQLLGCHTRLDLVSMVVGCVASRRAEVDSSVKHWNDRAAVQ